MEKISGSKRYLRADELTDGFIAERLAYLVRTSRKMDRNQNPYLSFYFKTADKVILIGHRFRIEEDDLMGINILLHNRSMVNVEFETQIYNGSFTLLIKKISMLPQEESSAFFDSYVDTDKSFDSLNIEADKLDADHLNLLIKSAGLLSVQYGMTGAYVELISIVFSILNARKTIHTNNMLKCMFAVANKYFEYLMLMEKIEFLPKNETLGLLQELRVKGDVSLTSIAADALSALMFQGKPEHLYAHIIVDAFRLAMKQMEFEEKVKSSPKNLIIKLEDGQLIYY